MTSRYAKVHENPQGPGDARPTAQQIIHDEDLEGKWSGRSVLITGASGGVGTFIVQLAALAGCHVIAASTSNARNAELLKSLGADETVEYQELWSRKDAFDVAIDTVGGDTLTKLWSIAARDAKIVSVESSSYDFANS